MKRVFYLWLMCMCCLSCTPELIDSPDTQTGGSISVRRYNFDGKVMSATEGIADNGGLRIYSLMPNGNNNRWKYTKYYDLGYVPVLGAFRSYMTVGKHAMYLYNTPVTGYTGYGSNEGYASLSFPEMPAKNTPLDSLTDYIITLNKVESQFDDGLEEYLLLDTNTINSSNLYFPPYDLGFAKEVRELTTSTNVSATLERKVAKLKLSVKFSNQTTLANNQVTEIVAVVKGRNRALCMEDASVVAQEGEMSILVGNPSLPSSAMGGGYALSWNEATKCDTGEVLLLPNLSGVDEGVSSMMLYLKRSDGSITTLPLQLSKRFEAGKQNNVTVSLKLNVEMNFQIQVDDVWEEQSEDIYISDKYELNTYKDSTEINSLYVTSGKTIDTIFVKSNTLWLVESSEDWALLSHNKGYQDGFFVVNISASPSTVTRMGEITITYGEGGIKKTLLVEQAASSPNVNASMEVSYLSNSDRQTSISYTANASVEASVKYSIGSDWLTLTSTSGGSNVLMKEDSTFLVRNEYSVTQPFSLIVGCTSYTEGNTATLYLTTVSGGQPAVDSVQIVMGENAVKIYENGVLLDGNQIYVGYGWQIRRLHIETTGQWKVSVAVEDNSKWLAAFPQSGVGSSDIWIINAANNDYNNYLNNNINFPEGRNADMRFMVYEDRQWHSSTVLKVYQDAVYQSILTDVNSLEFPWNQTFGRTSYTIKQRIHILACTQNSFATVPGNNNSEWTAEINCLDGGDWLHTTSPLVGAGTGQIEFYCDNNTGTTERYAQVLFRSSVSGTQVRKVVYISQNAKRAGDDRRFPVPVRYFEGSNQLSNMSVMGSGQWGGYSVPSFYMGTYELTAQAYCDFLNDIGIRSNSIPSTPSGNYNGSINADYKAVAIDRYPYTSQDREEAGRWFDEGNSIAFTGIWEPVIKKINDGFSESIEESSISGSYANYCMTGLSWCGAYEYAYWMNYYAQENTPIPENDKEASWVMPSEAMWEYAARGGKGNDVFSLPIALFLKRSDVSNSSYNIGQVGSQYWTAWYSDKAYGGMDQPLCNLYGRMPVGLLLSGENGTYDMAGNAGEWCFDWYSSDYPFNSSKSNPYGSPSALTYKVYRGGVVSSSADVSSRNSAYPINIGNTNRMDTYIGFRPSVQ